jgi:SAM-dependent methyltransferase
MRTESIASHTEPISHGRAEARPASAECANFDRLASLYRWMEWFSFGPFLQRCRCTWLSRLGDRRRALVLGDGDGRFTARLLRANSRLELDAVDASPAMLRALIERAGPHASRIAARAADVRNWQPASAGYDLVVTHFFLDCLTDEEVRRLVRLVRGTVSEKAVWLISEFAVPESRFGRLVAAPLVQGLYWAFGWLTGLRVRSLPNHKAALRENGFTLTARRAWLHGLLVSELWRASE